MFSGNYDPGRCHVETNRLKFIIHEKRISLAAYEADTTGAHEVKAGGRDWENKAATGILTIC